jgi:hypothetical protein
MLAGRGPLIDELELTNAGQEYPYQLNDGNDNSKPSLKALQFRCRDNTSIIQYSFVSGGTFFTLKANEVYWKDMLESYGITIYFKSATAGAVVEIEAWH